MNPFYRIGRWFSGNATSDHKGPQTTQPASIVHEDTPNYSLDGALQTSTVWACTMLLVENISSLPLMVYELDKDGERTVNHASRLYQILHKSPNARHSSMEFWECLLLNFFLRGNAYARIERDAKGEVIALWPLNSDQMEVIAAEDGSLLYGYQAGNSQLIYTQDQILHIRGPGNGVVGMSPLDFMRSSIGLAVSTQNHTAKTFRKEARRPGILMSDTVLNAEQRAAVKKNFGDIATGGGRELYVLEAQFKFEPLGMSPSDIQLLETRRFAVQDLARWFGVPSVLINDTGETTALGSSVGQIIDGFHRLKLRPTLERIEQALEKRVLTPGQRAKGITVEFNLDALLRASLAERVEIYAKASQNGVYTRNECRKYENKPALPGGDDLTVQSNLVPLHLLSNSAGGKVSESTQPIRQ